MLFVLPHAQESRKRLPWKPCIFIVKLSLSLRTKILCISGVPMNDLAPIKIVLGEGLCKVGQISSRGNTSNAIFIFSFQVSKFISPSYMKHVKHRKCNITNNI